MRNFREYCNDKLLETKIGMLAYMFAYHKLSANHFVDWYVTEGRYLTEEQLVSVLTEDAPQSPGLWGSIKNFAYNHPMAAAGMAGTASAGPAGGALAAGSTWLGKKAYNWWNSRNSKDPVGRAAQQILPQLQQLRQHLKDPQGQKAVDTLLTYLGNLQQQQQPQQPQNTSHGGMTVNAPQHPMPTGGNAPAANKQSYGGTFYT